MNTDAYTLHLSDSSSLDWEGVNRGKFLFRGINQSELEQLLRDGPYNFKINNGTQWKPRPGRNVKFLAGVGYNTYVMVEVERDTVHFTSNNYPQQEECTQTYETQVRVYDSRSLPDY